MEKRTEKIKLPLPKFNSNISIEATLKQRRSIRKYPNKSLTLQEISQLLWSAQGITSSDGLRTVPSAGALFPLEIYLVSGNLNGIDVGIYKYNPERHELSPHSKGDRRKDVAAAALDQEIICQSAASIIIAAVYERVTSKYGKRGIRYVDMEVGHSVQNIHLQSVSLGIGAVVVGAFNDEKIKNIIGMDKQEQPLCIMPIGKI